MQNLYLSKFLIISELSSYSRFTGYFAINYFNQSLIITSYHKIESDINQSIILTLNIIKHQSALIKNDETTIISW